MKNRPPKLANRLLGWFCKPELLESIQGDLEEYFARNKGSEWKNKWMYWFQVINIIRPFALKRWKLFHNNFATLLRLNILVSFRSFYKSSFFASINVVGLGIGLFSCLLILAYVSHQFSYDAFHVDAEKTYRITQRISKGDKSLEKIATYSRVGSELALSQPSVEEVCRIAPLKGTVVVERGDKHFLEQRLLAVDSSFFELFTFPFIYGSAQAALVEPGSIVITESIFEKLFVEGDNPLGQEIVIDGALGNWTSKGYQDRLVYKVMGVIEDVPANTHLDFDYLISFNLYPDLERELNNWGEGFYTYIKIADPSNAPLLHAGLTGIVDTYWPNQEVSLNLQPLRAIHLNSNLVGEFKRNGSQSSLWLLMAVAAVLMLIAGTNYLNFSTAKAITRQKEIGIRKIFWAKSSQLFAQLMTEAFLLNAAALVFAFLLIPILNPLVSEVLAFDLLQRAFTSEFLLLALTLFLSATLLSGFYPALSLSRLRMRGVVGKGAGATSNGATMRKLLVGFQFVISLLVIGFSVILHNQMSYINQKELGVNLDRTVVVYGPTVGVEIDSIMNLGLLRFRQEAQSLSNMEQVTFANFIPGDEIRGDANGYVRRLGTPESDANAYSFSQVGYRFFDALEIPLIAGRAFDPAISSDRSSIIINREAAFQLGFNSPKDAIGQKIIYRRQSTPVIIGVVEDFHQYSLRRDFQPIIFEVREAPAKYCYLRVANPEDLSQLITLQESWEALFPGNPFDFFFLDARYADQYQQENRFVQAFGMFSVLAVLVASLGILGLAFFIAKSSEKEIGIRKALGASFNHVNMIVIKRLGVYVVLACVLSIPFTYLLANHWLNAYAFRITIEWWMLALPAVCLVGLAIAVVTSQSLRVFRINPTQTLQTE